MWARVTLWGTEEVQVQSGTKSPHGCPPTRRWRRPSRARHALPDRGHCWAPSLCFRLFVGSLSKFRGGRSPALALAQPGQEPPGVRASPVVFSQQAVSRAARTPSVLSSELLSTSGPIGGLS